MTDKEKTPPAEYEPINLRKDSGQRKRFLAAHDHYKADTGHRPTQGEFLMLLLDTWENREV